MKRIIFAAFLAIVATSGSYASYKLTPGIGTPEFDCLTSQSPSCRSQVGTTFYNAQTGAQVPANSPAYDLQYQEL
jgi:hypothetical protein